MLREQSGKRRSLKQKDRVYIKYDNVGESMNTKKTGWIIAGIALVLVAAIIASVFLLRESKKAQIDENVNLLHNGSFEEIDSNGLPDGWIEGKWYWDNGISMLEVSDEAYSGNHSIMVYSASENDARFTQSIAVQPNSYYRLTCMVKAEGCGISRNGAGISIENTFISSEYVYDTKGEWVQLTLYGKTGADQKYITVMARIGGYGSLNVGRAWFDDIELHQLKALPDGVYAQSFATNKPSSARQETADVAEDDGTGSIWGLSALFALLMGVAVLMLGEKRDKKTSQTVLLAGAAIALILRVIFAVSIRGYEVDMNCFTAWSSWMVNYGPTGFYNAGWCDYPPGYMLVLGVLGGIRQLLGLTADGPAVWLLFKSVPILCDCLTGLMIYKLAEKKLGSWQATLLALVYLINPATILNSAAWGQVDSVLTLLLVAAMYFAVSRRWVASLSIYGIAVLAKPQALMFGPIGLLAVICELCHTDKEDYWKNVVEIVKGIFAMLGIMLLVITPFALGQGVNPFKWAFDLYGGTLSSYPYITINACNLYSLLGKNWVKLTDAGWLQYLAWGMYGLAFVYAFFIYIRSHRKNGSHKHLFLTCAVMLSIVFAFGAKMHERYLHPVMAFLLIAYIIDNDWRLLLSMLLLTLGQFVNGALVLENEHLQSGMKLINGMASIANIAGAFVTAWAGWELCVRGVKREVQAPVLKAEDAQQADNTNEIKVSTVRKPKKVKIVREDHKLHMKRVDYLIMAAITAIYSVVAFTNLGSPLAPETAWTSTMNGETVEFDLGEVQDFNMTYYGGICNSSFTVSFSEDAQTWTEPRLAIYDQGEIFRWLWYTPVERNDKGQFTRLASGYPVQTARYVRITAERAGLVLHEFGFLNADGEPLPIASVMSYGGDGARTNNPMLLADEQNTVAAYPSYYNSTYFDEIYHARTAYEHLHGLRPYETTHPPLGKVMIMWGVQLFGMTPFGWRFMGTLLGCLMLPVMYLLVKQLLKKTEYAAIATFLLAVDCMHFTQTRIATIDTYGVFYIMLMYLFMFRYCQMNFFTDDFKKTLIPLGLCGISMGLGIASKWICIYAAVGLAILFFFTLGRRYLEYRSAVTSGGTSPEEEKARKNFWKYFCITGAFCIVFFIVIPLLIYYFSYYWYMKPMGGLSVESVWKAQLSMFNYHSGLTNDTHSFASPWYEWPLIVKPMWYFSGTEFMPAGVVSSISCMGNPAVWWCGAAAMVFVLFKLMPYLLLGIDWVLAVFPIPRSVRLKRFYALAEKIRRRREKDENVRQNDRNYLYVAIGFAAQYVPWMLVPRSMFIYHYFASVPFIIIAIMLVSKWMKEKNDVRIKAAADGETPILIPRVPMLVVLMAAALVLFIAFYPLMSGTPVARSFAMYLRWFNWYNF